MIINEQKKDLFSDLSSSKAELIVIPHVNNNLGVAGAGFVIPLYKNFPKAKELYQNSPLDLGSVSFWNKIGAKEGYDVLVCNMVAQNGVSNYKSTKSEKSYDPSSGEFYYMEGVDSVTKTVRPLHYGYLVRCMMKVKEHLKKAHYNKKVEIRAPRFGSDLAGGDFSVIRELIEVCWEDYPTYIYYL